MPSHVIFDQADQVVVACTVCPWRDGPYPEPLQAAVPAAKHEESHGLFQSAAHNRLGRARLRAARRATTGEPPDNGPS
jgi:hypothetical protein